MSIGPREARKERVSRRSIPSAHAALHYSTTVSLWRKVTERTANHCVRRAGEKKPQRYGFLNGATEPRREGVLVAQPTRTFLGRHPRPEAASVLLRYEVDA